MDKKTIKKAWRQILAPIRYEITGAGVLHIRSSEILKTEEAKQQINALGNIEITKSKKSA